MIMRPLHLMSWPTLEVCRHCGVESNCHNASPALLVSLVSIKLGYCVTDIISKCRATACSLSEVDQFLCSFHVRLGETICYLIAHCSSSAPLPFTATLS